MEMRRCFAWYLGQNDAGVSLIEFKSHGCHDGLLSGGVNQNFGAESCVSWLLSLLTMHEMQPGEAPDRSWETIVADGEAEPLHGAQEEPDAASKSVESHSKA